MWTRKTITAISIFVLFSLLGSNALVACAQQQEKDNTSYIINPDEPFLADIAIGSSASEVQNLDYPMSWSEEQEEGESYPSVEITVFADVTVKGIFDQKDRLYSLETLSPKILDINGIGVGGTLNNLRKKYPEGSFFAGNEHSKFATYTTDSYLVIHFNADQLPEECFLTFGVCAPPDDLEISKLVLYGDITS